MGPIQTYKLSVIKWLKNKHLLYHAPCPAVTSLPSSDPRDSEHRLIICLSRYKASTGNTLCHRTLHNADQRECSEVFLATANMKTYKYSSKINLVLSQKTSTKFRVRLFLKTSS